MMIIMWIGNYRNQARASQWQNVNAFWPTTSCHIGNRFKLSWNPWNFVTDCKWWRVPNTICFQNSFICWKGIFTTWYGSYNCLLVLLSLVYNLLVFIQKFCHYILGCKFTLIVDNKPLHYIFNPNPNKYLHATTDGRLLRYSIFLMVSTTISSTGNQNFIVMQTTFQELCSHQIQPQLRKLKPVKSILKTQLHLTLFLITPLK